MKSWQRIAVCGLIMAFCSLTYCGQAPAQTNVGLIDMGLVFESHPGFKQRLGGLKQEADSLQSFVLQQRQMLAKEQESLALLYTPSSNDYKEKEKELALKLTQLELDAKDKMRDLMTQEARLHFDVFNDVNRVVDEYCNQFGIRLVLRFNSETMKPDNPESIMQQVNSPVVFYQTNRDITAAIIQRVAQANAANTSTIKK